MSVYPSHNILHSLSQNFKNREINMGTIPLANLKTLFKLYNGSFSTDVIFSPKNPTQHSTLHLLFFPNLLQFATVPQSILFLMILITLKSYFAECPSVGACLVCLMIGLRSFIPGRRTPETAPCLFQYIVSLGS